MKPTLALLIMAVFSALAAARAQDAINPDKPLSAYRDKNRVLLVFAPTELDPTYREQIKLWQNEKTGFDERQLLVLPVFTDAKRPAGDPPGTLAKKYNVYPKTFEVVLVGKDGHDAYRSAKPVPPASLYAAIDAMPMRRAEMKHPSPTGSPTPAATPTAPPHPTPAKPDLDHDE